MATRDAAVMTSIMSVIGRSRPAAAKASIMKPPTVVETPRPTTFTPMMKRATAEARTLAGASSCMVE